jgi:hypothetical protein
VPALPVARQDSHSSHSAFTALLIVPEQRRPFTTRPQRWFRASRRLLAALQTLHTPLGFGFFARSMAAPMLDFSRGEGERFVPQIRDGPRFPAPAASKNVVRP